MSPALQIEGHRFVPPVEGWDLRWQEDQVRGEKIVPRVAVIHYGVTKSHEELERALLVSDYVSAHVAITGRYVTTPTGEPVVQRRLTQMVPFNVRAGHAGRAARYQGEADVNSFSLGLEINNPGPLLRRGDGVFTDVYGRALVVEPDQIHHGRHRNSGFPWEYWLKYDPIELGMVVAICLAWRHHYGITDVVGHDEIRTDKADPGPAFSISWLRQAVFG